MSQECLILVRNAGHAIPAEILEPALAKYNRYASVAFADDSMVRITRLSKSDKWEPNLASIQGADVKFKDRQVVWCFGSSADDPLNNAELQPYSLLSGDQNNPLVVAFLDGDFSQYNTAGSTRHAQSVAVEKDLEPRVKKSFKHVGDDLQKLMEDEMTDPIMARDICNNMVGDSGSIVVLSANDLVIKYNPNTEASAKEYPWGWASNTHYLQPEEAADPLLAAIEATKSVKPIASVTPIRPTASARIVPAGTTAAPVRPATAPAKPDVGKPTSSPPSPAQPEVIEKGDDWVKVKVPKNLEGNSKAKGNFLRKRYPGALPEGWYPNLHEFSIPLAAANDTLKGDMDNKKSFVTVFKKGTVVKGVVKSFQELGPQKPAVTTTIRPSATAPKVGGRIQPAGTQEKPKDVKPTEQPKKDVAPHHITDKPQPGIVPKVWLIPPAERVEMLAFMSKPEFKEALDRNSQRIAPPDTFKEADIPSFAKQLGHPSITNIVDTINWDDDLILPMIQKNPNCALAFLRDWKQLAIKEKEANLALRAKVAELEGKKYDAEKDLDTTGTGIMKKEKPAAQPAAGRIRPAGAAA